jgi:hypothetical protein
VLKTIIDLVIRFLKFIGCPESGKGVREMVAMQNGCMEIKSETSLIFEVMPYDQFERSFLRPVCAVRGVFLAPVLSICLGVPVGAAVIPVGTKIKWERNEILSEQSVPAGAKYKIIAEDGSVFEGTTSSDFTFKNKKKDSRASIATVVIVVGDPIYTVAGYQNFGDITVTYDFTGLNDAIPDFEWRAVDVSYEGAFSLDIEIPVDPLSAVSTISRFEYNLFGFSDEPIAVNRASGVAVSLGNFNVRTLSSSPMSSTVTFSNLLEGTWQVSLKEQLITDSFLVASDAISDPQSLLEVTDKDGTFGVIPVPPALPMLATALVCLFGVVRRGRKR